MTLFLHLFHFLFQTKLQLLSNLVGEYPKEVISAPRANTFSGGVKVFYSFYV